MEQDIREMKDMLTLIYEELKEVKVRVTNLEKGVADLSKRTTSLENKVEALEISTNEKFASMDERISRLEAFTKRRTCELQDQAHRHFEILERDLGAAIEWSKFLQERKVDKKALKKAAL